MPDFDAISRDHVLQTLEEYDERGGDAFLEHHGFARAREYILSHDGRSYDSKAVLEVAYQRATGTDTDGAVFSGGKHGAAKTLRRLGFEVSFIDDTQPEDAVPEPEVWQEADEVGLDASRELWAEQAREVLLVAARRYNSLVTHKELATAVQSRTGIRSRQLTHYWIGDVLGRVAADCAKRDEPLLPALCVNATGGVGEAYCLTVASITGERPEDGDDHAAVERLNCYRHFEAPDLPADGGVPRLTPKVAAARTRDRKAKALVRPVMLCPTCHTQVPSTGVCDFCD